MAPRAFPSFRLLSVLTALSFTFTLPGTGAPGEVDGRWASLNIGGTIATAAAHPDQGIWVAGGLEIPMGGPQPHRNLLRLLPIGLADTTMNGQFSTSPTALRLLPDAKIMMAGSGGNGLLRKLSNGQNDSSFSAPILSSCNVLGLTPEQGYLVGRGNNTGLDRLSRTGSLDPDYAPGIAASIQSLAVLPDGSCYAGGQTTGGSGVLARISASGVKDPDFAPDFDGPVLALTVQPDGKILAGGSFTRANGVPFSGLVRLLPDGTLDDSYAAILTGPPNATQVSALLPQADGAVLISGTFSAVSGSPRPGMARLTADGALDPAFSVPDPVRYGINVKLLGMLPDGRVLAEVPGSAGKQRIILLQNDSGTSSLTVTGPGEITWTRTGAVPAVAQAWFEIYDSPSSSWVDLGPPVRTPSGWKLTVPTLPVTGLVRAVGNGPAAGGESSGSFISDAVSLDAPTYSMTVHRQDSALSPVSLNFINFNQVWLDSPASIPLALRNRGTGTLTGLSFSITGSGAASYELVRTPGPTLAAGGTAEFALAFTPKPFSPVGAALTITSDSPSVPPITINLSGSGIPQQTVSFDPTYRPAQRAEGFNPARLTILGLSFNTAIPTPAGQALMLIDNVSSNPINGIFEGMPQGIWQEFTVSFGKRLYQIDYSGGDGNDLVLYPVFYGGADPDFRVEIAPATGVNLAMRLRNGGFLVGGQFTSVNLKPYPNLCRLHPNGSLDESFQPAVPSGAVISITETDSGKLLIGMPGTSGVVRLKADGSADPGFACQPDDWVDGMVPLPGERTLVMGRFSNINGIPRNRMAILNADGSLDPDFQPQPNAQVYSAVHLADGKFLVGGSFTQMNGVARGGLVRLNPDGSLDTSFTFNRPTVVVTSLAVQMNGRILYAASGTVLRALENGDHDPSFSPPYLSFLPVRSIIPQTNGKVLAGISNSNALAPQKDGVIRLNADGGMDSTFECPLSGVFDTAPIEVLGLHLGSDGALLIGGSFTRAGTEPRTGLIRTQLEAPVESLTVPSASRIQWLRGGGLPDCSDITFALHDTLGETWIPLGRGTAIPGGWELTGLSLPAAGTIRATARVSGGRTNSSYSFCDSTRPYEIGPLQAWRLQYFSTADNSGQAANGADPDQGGLTNLAEYALGLVPTLPDAAGLPSLEAEDGHLELRFTPPSNTSNILYTAEASDDPSASSWTPVEDSGMTPECRFRLPLSAQRLYMRLRFTLR